MLNKISDSDSDSDYFALFSLVYISCCRTEFIV